MAQQPKGEPSNSSVQWVEQELQEAKSRIQKLEHDLTQGLKQVWSLEAEHRKLADALAASGAATQALVTLREDLRQVRDQVNRSQDRQTAVANRADEVFRQSQAEVARGRQEVVALGKQMEGVVRAAAQYEGRMQAIEEVARRFDDALGSVRLSHQATIRDIEELAARVTRSLESLNRLDHETSLHASQIEAQGRQDDALAERSNLLQEMVRRLEERATKVESLLDFPQEVREALHSATVERVKLAERLNIIERLTNELADRVQEFADGLLRVDQRGQTQAPQILLMAEQMQEFNRQTMTHIKRLMQVMLRQRRRQVDALSQEIKELSQGEFNNPE